MYIVGTFKNVNSTFNNVNSTFSYLSSTFNIVNSTFNIVYSTFNDVNCTFNNVNCTFNNENCTFNIVYSTFNNINCTFSNVNCTFNNVNSTLNYVNRILNSTFLHTNSTYTSLCMCVYRQYCAPQPSIEGNFQGIAYAAPAPNIWHPSECVIAMYKSRDVVPLWGEMWIDNVSVWTELSYTHEDKCCVSKAYIGTHLYTQFI